MQFFGFCGILLLSLEISAQEPRYRGSFTIPHHTSLVSVHAGDVDGNGKLDLVATTAGQDVTVFFQDDEDRYAWTPVSIPVGQACSFALAGDFNNDGFADLAVADRSSTTYVIRSKGDRTFGEPLSLIEAPSSRWITVGDWDFDTHLDLASSNLWSDSVTIFVGDGGLDLFRTDTIDMIEEQRAFAIEALDFNGDGELDLAMGLGTAGLQLLRGLGDGTFLPMPGPLETLGCIEYLSIGDFNNDNLDDIASSCGADRTAYVGISDGEGGYTQVLSDPFAAGLEVSAISDFNGDGNDDLALASLGSTLVKVYLSKGDSTFEDPIVFGSTADGSRFLIAEDIDQDGHLDIVSADAGLTVFFGSEGDYDTEGKPPFESSRHITGYGSARARTVADMNNDGLPEFFYADSLSNTVRIYVNPDESSREEADFEVATTTRYSLLDTATDLNGDGIADLIGGSTARDVILITLLNAEGNADQEHSIPCSGQLRRVASGFLDEPVAAGDGNVDIIAHCGVGATTENLLLFFGRGDGTFDTGPVVRSISGAREFDLADVDGDGLNDVAVGASASLAIHYGIEGGGLTPPGDLIQGPTSSFEVVRIADLDADGHGDVLTGGRNSSMVRVYRGRGSREFEEPIELNVGLAPTTLQVIDLDGDGRTDVAAGGQLRSIHLVYNLGQGSFSEPQAVTTGFAPTTFQVVDVNGDRARDIAAFSGASTVVILNRGSLSTPGFKRGDVDGSGTVDITDPLLNLTFQFLGTPVPLCHDALDTDDSGLVDVSDPLNSLMFQFLGSFIVPAPGVENCGPDPTADGDSDLGCEAYPQTSCNP